jgi:suppressor of fused
MAKKKKKPEPPPPDDDIVTVGWDAISSECDRIYPGVEPFHTGPIIKARLGGPDFLDSISIYTVDTPTPHWHYVTYGMSELYRKELQDPEVSGWGYEFTFRVARSPKATEPPGWAVGMLNNIARYVYTSGNPIEPGHYMDANGPLCVGSDTLIRAIAFTHDPDLQPLTTPNGKLSFLQIVGITLDEFDAILAWNTHSLLELLEAKIPKSVTDLDRESILKDRGIAKKVAAGQKKDGSNSYGLFPSVCEWAMNGKKATLRVGANGLKSFSPVLRGRLPFGWPMALMSKTHVVRFVPADANSWQVEEDVLVLSLDPKLTQKFAKTFAKPKRGMYHFAELPNLIIEVSVSQITGNEGQVIEEVG